MRLETGFSGLGGPGPDPDQQPRYFPTDLRMLLPGPAPLVAATCLCKARLARVAGNLEPAGWPAPAGGSEVAARLSAPSERECRAGAWRLLAVCSSSWSFR